MRVALAPVVHARVRARQRARERGERALCARADSRVSQELVVSRKNMCCSSVKRLPYGELAGVEHTRAWRSTPHEHTRTRQGPDPMPLTSVRLQTPPRLRDARDALTRAH